MVLIVILVAWYIVEFSLRKLMKIKGKGIFGKYEHPNKKHELIERYIIIIFLLLVTIEMFVGMFHNSFTLIWLYLMTLSFNRGIQEWKFDRENKEYIFSWIGSTFLLMIFVLFLA